MFKRILGLILLSFILSSYDPPFVQIEGKIIDKNTSNPIDSAKISVNESAMLFTDNYGAFKTELMGLRTGLEILIEKNGYEPTYINFTNEKYNLDNAVITLQPTTVSVKLGLSQNSLRFLNTLIKILFSISNALTLIFILFHPEIKLKFLWITAVFLINPAFRLLHFGNKLLDFEILNGPFYLFNYWNYPYSLLIAIPVVSIVFWILFLAKRAWLLKKKTNPAISQD